MRNQRYTPKNKKEVWAMVAKKHTENKEKEAKNVNGRNKEERSAIDMFGWYRDRLFARGMRLGIMGKMERENRHSGLEAITPVRTNHNTGEPFRLPGRK